VDWQCIHGLAGTGTRKRPELEASSSESRHPIRGLAVANPTPEGSPSRSSKITRQEGVVLNLSTGVSDVLFWLQMATWCRIFNEFDRQHGTETGGVIDLHRLGIHHQAAKFGTRYQAVDTGVFRRARRSLRSEIDTGAFTFIDLGCGKGRAILLARDFPFKDLIGVELSSTLATIARKNLMRATIVDAKIICQDAAEFRFPPGRLIVYLFNPFVGYVFRRMIQNLCRSVTEDVYLVYINPVEEHILLEKDCFVRLKYDGTFAIYQHIPHPMSAVAARQT
jgi:SAM-dependent methyltransferase